MKRLVAYIKDRLHQSVFLLLLFGVAPDAIFAQQWKVSSPNKDITINIFNEGGSLSYDVSFKNKIIIGASPLGIDREDANFSSQLKFISKSKETVKESYRLLVGKKLQCSNKAKEQTLVFENPAHEKIELTFRAYQDGIAFRYHFPANDGTTHKIVQEKTGFAIPNTAKAWIQPYDLNVRMKPCYETYYENGIAPGTPSPNPAGWAFPALFNIGENWALVTEAGLDETYCATHLEDRSGNGIYTIRFPEREEVTSSADPEPVSSLPWTTPWRVIIIGPSLGAVQKSSLVTDVSPGSTLTDTSWIKPGRASWSWWSVGSSPRDFQAQKEYVDFTASMGWEYVLIDSGWPWMEGGNAEDVVRYANSKGVGIFLWYHSGMGRERDTLSMANLMAFPESRKKELQRIRDWGVKGIKVDFFDSDKQPVIQRYMDILRDADDYHIMVNFHGSTLPRGWERTYPHLVSMESVKGAEGYGRQDFCDRAPSHNTILPFTRNIVGPMDYTPVTFTNKREAIRQTSVGHELALSIVFESGVFHFADRMSSYQSLPEAPKNFLKQVPVTWDETRYVAGIPGSYVVLARRKGSDWYIGGINGKNEPMEITLDLSFLKKEVTMELITDDEADGTFTNRKVKTDGKKTTVRLKPRGGFVAKTI
ncbi:MAG TPA: glycoside hydrolase family 97 catalytic domain-containing protein [Cyclobacteriaceae bacterium]|nr:glycoside hydrolase family 97 catalytic domain-containing protein [Cyclobacteriaceae bacterium]